MKNVELSNQELAVLLATRESENAQSVAELAGHTEQYPEDIMPALDGLVERDILAPIEAWHGGTVYIYTDTPISESIYCEIHKNTLED